MKKMGLQLQITFLREGDKFIAFAPALDLSTSGKNLEEVTNKIGEAISIFFDELAEDGTTEEVLQDLGWKKTNLNWSPSPTVISQGQQTIKVLA